MEEQKVILSEHLEQTLTEVIQTMPHDRLFVVCDSNTRGFCLPLMREFACMQDASIITLDPGDEHKTLEYVEFVWTKLQQRGATRHSLCVNLGGGMVTDLAGFALSTFKRGMRFINVPTTLLAMVDASVGGKTGFNYGGLKNEIGVFSNAEAVILDTVFLQTLDRENILSGYAEMLKHGLIFSGEFRVESGEFATAQQSTAVANSKHSCAVANSKLYTLNSKLLKELLSFDVESPDLLVLGRMVADSVKVKQRIVAEDPHEQGLRKALNLGHTVGHAFEAMALAKGQPVLHGYAVAWGLMCELYLSVMKTGFPVDTMRQVNSFILEHYGRMAITCDDYPTLLQLMTHDKKNTGSTINFTLLHDVGDLALNQTATREEIEETLDFYREGL
ncbi:MAG: 3-dehydroquinate synthase [Prevotella sp.]|nr:3-dehydroquinate synthase [Prevotella sp.]